MDVILTKDVDKIGKSGELKTVADGFATNFLIPQKLAVPAVGGAYRAWQHDIASREDKRARERSEAEVTANRIASTTLTMGVKVGDAGKLYGSIGSKEIAEALARRGIVVEDTRALHGEQLQRGLVVRDRLVRPADRHGVARRARRCRDDEAVAAQGVEERLGAERLQRQRVQRHRLAAEVPGGEDLAVVVDEVGVGAVLERKAACGADGEVFLYPFGAIVSVADAKEGRGRQELVAHAIDFRDWIPSARDHAGEHAPEQHF